MDTKNNSNSNSNTTTATISNYTNYTASNAGNAYLNQSPFTFFTGASTKSSAPTPTHGNAYKSYSESSQELFNYSHLLPAATATATTTAATTTSTVTITNLNATLPGMATATATATASVSVSATATVITSEQEWSHFYDLVLSWQGICLIVLFCTLIIITVIGNTLVIMAVITTRRLRTVTNCFVMSLAVADLLVGIFVMPPAVAVHLVGSWQLGWMLCDIWISLDVLLCTASILSLCAISVDRYFAVTKPLNYSRKRRSKRLALLMILIVWVLAIAITCPPMLGWYEPGRRDQNECRYNQNKGYVIYSAMGSFFIPMVVMIYVYARISCVIASRHDKMTNVSIHNKKFRRYTSADMDNDLDNEFFEPDFSLSQDRKLQATRTFSNQTIVNELHEVIMSDVENGCIKGPHTALLTLTTPTSNGKGNCYELTRPVSLKITTEYTHTLQTAGMRHTYAPGVGAYGTRHNHHHNHHHHHHHQHQNSQQQQQQQQMQNSQNNFKSLANCIISLKKEHKTTQTLSIVVGGFIACWLPFFIYYLITPFLEPQLISRTLTNILTWLGWFSSAINPFIYAFYSTDFRVAFWRLMCRRVCKRPQSSLNTMSMRL